MAQQPTNSEQLSAWLDGELSDGEAAAIERELDRDARLRAELDELREVRELLRTHGPLKAPKGFHARVLAQADQEPLPANHSLWRFLRRPFGVPIEALAVAAAALLVVIAGLDLGAGALQAPFESYDFGSRGSRSDKGDAKEQVAAPVAPKPEQALDPAAADAARDSGPGEAEATKQTRKAAPGPKKEMTRASEGEKPAATTTAAKESAQNAAGAAEAGSAEAPDVSLGTASSKGYTEEQAAPSGWRFMFVSNPDILGTLQRIAAQTGAIVEDSRHTRVTDGRIDPGDDTTYWLRVPAEKLPRAVDLLQRGGGNATEQRAGQFNPGQIVLVRIDILLESSKQAAPATQAVEPPPKK